MKVRITLVVDRDPIDLAPSGDLEDFECAVLEDFERAVEDDVALIAWLLEAPVSDFHIEAITEPTNG
jgi:hypothetical protein